MIEKFEDPTPKSLEDWEVYISGETVKELLERFKENGAIGLVDIKVKAIIPQSELQKREQTARQDLLKKVGEMIEGEIENAKGLGRVQVLSDLQKKLKELE